MQQKQKLLSPLFFSYISCAKYILKSTEQTKSVNRCTCCSRVTVTYILYPSSHAYNSKESHLGDKVPNDMNSWMWPAEFQKHLHFKMILWMMVTFSSRLCARVWVCARALTQYAFPCSGPTMAMKRGCCSSAMTALIMDWRPVSVPKWLDG